MLPPIKIPSEIIGIYWRKKVNIFIDSLFFFDVYLIRTVLVSHDWNLEDKNCRLNLLNKFT